MHGMWGVMVAALPACGYPQLSRLGLAPDAAESDSSTVSDAATGLDPGTDSSAIDSQPGSAASNTPAPFSPLHLDPALLLAGAPDLTLDADPSLIDTSALTVNGSYPWISSLRSI